MGIGEVDMFSYFGSGSSAQIVTDIKAEALKLLNQGLEEPIGVTPGRQEYLAKMEGVINARNALQAEFDAKIKPLTGWVQGVLYDSAELVDLRKTFNENMSESTKQEAIIRLEYQQKVRANQIIDSIPGSEVLKSEARFRYLYELFKLEQAEDAHKKEKYKNQSNQNAVNRAIAWAVSSEAVESEEFKTQKNAVIKKIEQSILETKRAEVRTKLKEKLAKYDTTDLNTDVKKTLILELENALIRQKDNPALKNPGVRHMGRKIKVAIELSKIPNFLSYDKVIQLKIIDEIAAIMRTLAKIKLKRQEHQDRLERENNETNKKLSLAEIKTLTENATQESEKLANIVIQISSNKLSLDAELKKEIEEEQARRQNANVPNVRDAEINPVISNIANAVGKVSFLFGTRSQALITSVLKAVEASDEPVETNVYRHQRANIKDLVMFLPREIDDILTKPKSYIDRLFRGGMLVGGTVGMSVAVPILLGLLGNPFTGAATLGVILGVGVSIGVVAGTAKLAKWISRKTAEKIYGISDPDRYRLSKQAIAYFGEDNAKTIRKFFIAEIRSIHQEIEKLGEIASPMIKKKKSKMLMDKLFKIETAWNAIQDANNGRPLKEWRAYLNSVYPDLKVSYKEKVVSEVKEQINNVIAVLLSATKPEEKERTIETAATNQIPALTHDFTVSKAMKHIPRAISPKKNNMQLLYSSSSKSRQLEEKTKLLNQVDSKIKAGKAPLDSD
jgi:hypothetical protein